MFSCTDLLTWAHHTDVTTVPDTMLLKAIEVAQSAIREGDLSMASDRSSDRTPDGVTEVPENFQPVSFAMSCKVEFNEEMQTPKVLQKV